MQPKKLLKILGRASHRLRTGFLYSLVRAIVKKLPLLLSLVVLVTGLFLSAVLNISVCAWGCPSTLFVYSLQASFFVLVFLIVWVVYKLFFKKVAANA